MKTVLAHVKNHDFQRLTASFFYAFPGEADSHGGILGIL